jgi:hypothetical protein
MIEISPPSQNDPRSAIADWLELVTLFDSKGTSTKAVLLQIMDVLEDDAAFNALADPETGESLDESIVEERRTQFVDIAFEELEYRQSTLGESYPFTVDSRRVRLSRRDESIFEHPGRVVYLFCLLASAIREKRFVEPLELKDAGSRIPDIFQLCACLAAGGYLRGEVSSFGFPRAAKTNFLDALRKTYTRFGAGKIRETEEIPDGWPADLKDGGVDVVAWLNHPDRMPGKLYLLGQTASGLNWSGKPVAHCVPSFHSWFTNQPAQFFSPAIFIPFTCHHALNEPRRGPFLEALKQCVWYQERTFGIMFDRLRVAHFADVCMSLDERSREMIDGTDRLSEVQAWVRSTCEIAGLENAAA